MMRLFRGRDNGDASPSTPSPSHSSAEQPRRTPAATNVAGPARPIRFVYYDEKGKFQMDPEALAVLQLVKEPIGVVSVCGRARQGKSFVLNQLLGRSSGFQVASTHRPCTKGLWLWSAPLKMTALDGTEYNLILLDSEGIDAYDQTGTYSTQIFSLAVLLSSMFVYNQMGGIDEAALDRLSLVTEMTKHIRVRASGGKSTASELGQFSPIFVWLLRDFYLELEEDDRKITPRDYLELALRPVPGTGKDIGSKNEIRESIRALFPDRECFTLVRPLNNESQLQRLDQIPLEKMRPEFRSGLDAFTRFVFERTRPKQVGATIMNGPMLAGLVQSFLDALNNGAVPTITSSWQSVEEAECRRAFDSASEMYMASFDRSKPPEEELLREAHEAAIQRAVAEFNASAVGVGSVRQKYEKLLHTFFRKAFEDYKKSALMEADLQCANAIQQMERKLRSTCYAADAKLDQVVKVLDNLVSEYEASSHGPGKWRKLAIFLQQSLEGPISDLVKKQIDQIGSQRSSLEFKCRSIEDKVELLKKQLEASEKQKSEYSKRYEDAINQKKQLGDDYMARITNLQSKCSSLEERCSSLTKALESAGHDSSDWKKRYEQLLSKQKAEEARVSNEISILKQRLSTADARLLAAREQAQSAQQEAEEWSRKYDTAVKEARAALGRAADVQERANKNMQAREDSLKAEYAGTIAEKEKEIKEKAARIEFSEQRLTTLSLELKAAESKIANYNLEITGFKHEIRELTERLEAANNTAQSYEREAQILEQEKVHLEEKYRTEFARLDELQERCREAEKDARRSKEIAEKARTDLTIAQREKNEMHQLAMERHTDIERAERQIENLKSMKKDLADEVENLRSSEMDARSKVALLEVRVEEREKEIESLMKSNNAQRASTVQVLESLLETERVARAEANRRAEALSVQLQATQGKLDSVQQELTSTRLNESSLDGRLRTASHGKRTRMMDVDYEMGGGGGGDSVELGGDRMTRESKKRRSSGVSPLFQSESPAAGGLRHDDVDDDRESQQTTDTEDYTKFTMQKLKQELTKNDFGHELVKLRQPNKKELIALYERCILQKT